VRAQRAHGGDAGRQLDVDRGRAELLPQAGEKEDFDFQP